MDTITSAHMKSIQAELQANSSTSDPGNTLDQSAIMRNDTENILSASQKGFDRAYKRNSQKLDKMTDELDKLHLSELSEKVRKTPENLYYYYYMCTCPGTAD